MNTKDTEEQRQELHVQTTLGALGTFCEPCRFHNAGKRPRRRRRFEYDLTLEKPAELVMGTNPTAAETVAVMISVTVSVTLFAAVEVIETVPGTLLVAVEVIEMVPVGAVLSSMTTEVKVVVMTVVDASAVTVTVGVVVAVDVVVMGSSVDVVVVVAMGLGPLVMASAASSTLEHSTLLTVEGSRDRMND